MSEERKDETRRLREGENIADPTSTSGRKIWGPCTVTTTRWPDGGLDVVVEREQSGRGEGSR